MFSVIIPLYNKEKYIKDTLKSVLGQTYNNFEVIIVNDGSTDGSMAVVESFDDPKVRVLNKKNGGAGSARNLGVKNAFFPFLAFIDADDIWEENFLSEMSIAIQKVPNQGIYSAKTLLKWNNRPFTEVKAKGEYLHLNPYIKYLDEFYCNSSSVVIPKTVFDKLGYFLEDYNVGEDNEMWVRIGLNYDVLFINKPLVWYNDINVYHSVRKNQAIAPYPFIVDTITRHYKLDVVDIPYTSARRYCQKIVVNYCIACIKNGRKDLVKKHANRQNLPRVLNLYVNLTLAFPIFSNLIPLFHSFKRIIYRMKQVFS